MKKPTSDGRWWLEDGWLCHLCGTRGALRRFAEYGELVHRPKCSRCSRSKAVRWTREPKRWLWIDGELVIMDEIMIGG